VSGAGRRRALGDLRLGGLRPPELVVSAEPAVPAAHRLAAERRNHRWAFAVTDEYDLQNLLRGILILYFDDIRPEERNPSYRD
jgi:hypothetical protein